MSTRVRLQESDLDVPGITRRRRGRGFSYAGPDGRPLDPDELSRVKALVLPPAWRDVWICSAPNGHIQATGVDSAGRVQYRYHDEWRRLRDEDKHSRVLDFSELLPAVRRTVSTRGSSPCSRKA